MTDTPAPLPLTDDEIAEWRSTNNRGGYLFSKRALATIDALTARALAAEAKVKEGV